jgi:hypothetical protein
MLQKKKKEKKKKKKCLFCSLQPVVVNVSRGPKVTENSSGGRERNKKEGSQFCVGSHFFFSSFGNAANSCFAQSGTPTRRFGQTKGSLPHSFHLVLIICWWRLKGSMRLVFERNRTHLSATSELSRNQPTEPWYVSTCSFSFFFSFSDFAFARGDNETLCSHQTK